MTTGLSTSTHVVSSSVGDVDGEESKGKSITSQLRPKAEARNIANLPASRCMYLLFFFLMFEKIVLAGVLLLHGLLPHSAFPPVVPHPPYLLFIKPQFVNMEEARLHLCSAPTRSYPHP